MELQNYIQMVTRLLHAYASAAAADPQLQTPSSRLRKRGRTTYRSERHLTQGLCCNFLPLAASLSGFSTRVAITLAASESTSDATTNHMPRVFIEEVLDQVPVASSAHSRRTLSGRFQHQRMQQGQEEPFQAAHPNHNYANHNSAFSLFYTVGPNGAASASPIIRVGKGLKVTRHRLETTGVDMGGSARIQRRTWVDMMLRGVGLGTPTQTETYPKPTTTRRSVICWQMLF
ncbi:hypothetical protein FIBSPDRAFT_551859 [Athelia psychrophila]|uniref:Uncharacterized protein n=1 Tax=Athelia psychrophila TaxID=1759441 RepID=A0A166UV72_9AGAM|nr:hypothetical protein FIBSPDRAFT_551859 [Fibularhizoctonia sp. CBS 109695]